MKSASTADLIIGAAAVADYRPSTHHPGKIRRGEGPISVELVPNPDMIAELAKAAKPGCRVIGFAAEPSADLDIAHQKLAKKGLFAIAANDVSQAGIGFDAEENELVLVRPSGEPEKSGRQSKLACALWLLERLASG